MPAKRDEPKAPKVERVAIDSIHVDPANVRRHPERNLAAIRASLVRFGQQKPIVVDAAGIVRAGNGTLEAARSLGWTHIDIVRSPLAGSEATAYAIADNRTAELAEWDDAALAEQLQALNSEDFDLAAVGFDMAEVEAMMDRIAGEIVDDPAGEWKGMPSCENSDVTAFRTLNVHFETAEAVADFAVKIGQTFSDDAKWIWHPELIRGKPSANPYVDEP